MDRFRVNGSTDEWFFAKLSDGLLANCEPYEAYEAIGTVVEYALKEHEADLFYDHVQFLIRLGRKSSTTEAPQPLVKGVSVLEEKATKFGPPQLSSLKELCTWFRLPFNKRL